METSALWEAYRQNRSIDNRNRLLIYYAPLVKRVVKSMPNVYGCYIDANDMIGDGMFGLMDAIVKYDAEKNVKFESYAWLRIRGAIIDKMRKLDLLSRHSRQRYKLLEDCAEAFSQEHHRTPSTEELAALTGLSENLVRKTFEEAAVTNMLSLEAVVAANEKGHEPASDEDGPESQFQKKETKHLLKEAITSLNEKEQQVISLYYYEELTLKEIGQVLSVSESRISQILSKTLSKLRFKMEIR